MSRGGDAVFVHEPVMPIEVVELAAAVPEGSLVLDATLGGAGHALRLLESRPDLRLLGLDQDDDALIAAERVLAPQRHRVTLARANFARLSDVLAEHADGEQPGFVLFDLGVSSPQLDRAERGFSYRAAAPLDMRMDQRAPLTAAAVVNDTPEPDLLRLLVRGGEDRFAPRIARAIVAARPLTTTAQLAEVVRDAIPAPARRKGGHPAKRTFQAVRIAVNAELDVLPTALASALDVVAPLGRIVVLSYHSGEDRLVKAAFVNAETGGCTCPPGLPCVCGAAPTVRLLNRGARKASAEEITRNPRAESVRLRAVERLAAPPSPSAPEEVLPEVH